MSFIVNTVPMFSETQSVTYYTISCPINVAAEGLEG